MAIVNMVKYTLSKYNGDADKVFAVGSSAGAMMVNVLLGAYPDVFAGGAALAGVAFGCFAANGVDFGSEACAQGKIVKTGAQWAAIVKAAYPGYTGTYPKLQVIQGTADTDIYPQNLQEEIKQWTSLLGLPSKAVTTTLNMPHPGWTKYVYGSKFEAYSAAGVDHLIPQQEDLVLTFFGLNSAADAASATPSTVPSAGTVAHFGQCGGSEWTGSTKCASGYTCTYTSTWYSQVSISQSRHDWTKLTVMTVFISSGLDDAQHIL